MSKFVKNRFVYMDYAIFFAMIFLSLFGTIMMYSANSYSVIVSNESPNDILIKQGVILALAVGMFFVTVSIPAKVYLHFSKIFYLISIALLIIVFLFPAINDSHSWIPIGFFNLQPSEVAKISSIIFFASYYEHHQKKLGDFNTAFIKPFYIFAIPFVLIVVQPDPGSAVILATIIFVVVLSSKITKMVRRKILLTIASFAVIIYFAVNFLNISTLERAISRFDSFLEPCLEYRESGFQVCNAIIAINKGGALGEGLGNSTQKNLYIPEAHTDAISAIVSEELGYLSVLVILAIYLFIIIRLVHYSSNAKNDFQRLTLLGVSAIIFIHVTVNLGGITGLIPLAGVPLPFLSYGGTFTLLMYSSLGISESIIISIRREGYGKNR